MEPMDAINGLTAKGRYTPHLLKRSFPRRVWGMKQESRTRHTLRGLKMCRWHAKGEVRSTNEDRRSEPGRL